MGPVLISGTYGNNILIRERWVASGVLRVLQSASHSMHVAEQCAGIHYTHTHMWRLSIPFTSALPTMFAETTETSDVRLLVPAGEPSCREC